MGGAILPPESILTAKVDYTFSPKQKSSLLVEVARGENAECVDVIGTVGTIRYPTKNERRPQLLDNKGWALLHSPLPTEALKPLDRSVYGVAGLTDTNEGYLIERLWQSGLCWYTEILHQEYLGSEDRKTNAGKEYRSYLAMVTFRLWIETGIGSGTFVHFDAVGADDNKKLDAAFKGAKTVGFKSACKEAGLTTELYKGGRMNDVIYDGGVNADAPSVSPPAAPPAAPALVMSDPQKAEMKRLVDTLPENVQKDARKAAFEAAKAAGLRDPAKAFEGGRSLLVAWHARFCGKSDCSHVAA